jgi:predicted metal-dependent peptidase
VSSSIPENLQAARLRLSSDRPYLAAALWALQTIEKEGMGTLAVDKFWRLYYDPKVPWNVEELSAVLYHEVNHLLRDHPGRAETVPDLQPDAWNIVCDAEINDDISKESSITLPEPHVLPSQFGQPDGLLAEEYYNKLPRLAMAGMSKGRKDGQSAPGNGKCGSCAGSPGEWEDGAPPQAGGNGPSGITPMEAELIRRKVAEDVRAESTNQRGTVPTWMKRWADSKLNPKIPWQKVLRGMVKHAIADVAGMVDYTYRRPSRRSSSVPDVVMPSLRMPLPKIAVVIDTSGSMGQDRLDKAIAEVAGVLKAMGQKDGVEAICVDAAVASAKKVFKKEQIELAGGGGTDMRVGIEYALKKKPHAIIVLTDGETPWPEVPVRAKVIACIIQNGIQVPPSWIKTVVVE